MKPVLTLDHIQKYYGNEGNLTQAIKDISFTVEDGEFLGIMGASGSGKTTLLNCISTIDTVSAGHIYLDQTAVTDLKPKQLARFRREKLGFIFQDFNLIPALNVWENIVLPLGLDGKKVNKGFVTDIVEHIGLAEKLKSLPNQLSGGQKQRVAIARALASRPAIILADEPTGNLDRKNSDETLELLHLSNRQYKQTVLLITHDEKTALKADRIITLEDGKIISDEVTN